MFPDLFVYRPANPPAAMQWTVTLQERETSTGYAEFCTWKQKLAKAAVRCYIGLFVTFSTPETIMVGWQLLFNALCSCPRYNKACCRWAHSSSSVSVQLSLLQSLLHNLIYHLPSPNNGKVDFLTR